MAPSDDRVDRGNRELIITPDSHVYVQDGTSGKIKTYVGPTSAALQGNDTPIVFNFEKGKVEFKTVRTLQEALRKNIVVPDGFYAVLMNPVRGGEKYPVEGEVKISPDLDVGNKVVIEGPKSFALWPGQSAKVIRGHHLRSNEYLVARVYNAEAARKSQGKVVLATPSGQGEGDTKPGDPPKETPPVVETKSDLTVGRLLIIKGTKVSFYIPPTGISVLLDTDDNDVEIPNKYVRDAITLEQLQYCILRDENGSKRYVHGPDVVFPEPTETFVRDTEGNSIFRAIELNELQGIHVKITRDYKDPVLGEMKEGQEIFITGKQYPIYFPREENVLVKYDGKTKVFAIAVPEGDARYVMDRRTGKIELAPGPQMLLPNPVSHIIVRRPLTDQQCQDWYPGNSEALEWNRALRKLAEASPTTRQGAVSEGEIERGGRRKGIAGQQMSRYGRSSLMEDAGAEMMLNYAAPVAVAAASLMDTSSVSNDPKRVMADEISRGSSFTQPRTIMLGGKFEGVPKIEPFTGFAVMIVNSKGDRRVVQGPAKIMLAYDEVLEVLTLSTGKPKNTDKLIRTPYLRTMNNKVADIVSVETGDNVVVELKLSYHVNFFGDPKKWWDVENYIKFLCDHMRSLLKARAKEIGIEDLYANPLNIVRQVVLGDGGEGTAFEENGMKVSDVEVLSTVISDAVVRELLVKSQKASLERLIKLADLSRNLEATRRTEEITQEEMEVKATTITKRRELEKVAVTEDLALQIVKIASAIEQMEKNKGLREAEDALKLLGVENDLERDKLAAEQDNAIARLAQELEIAKMGAEADAAVKRFSAISGGLSEALLTLSSQRTLADVAQALSVQKFVGGQNAVEVIGEIFKGTGFAQLMEKLNTRASGLPNGNGDKKALTAPGA